MNKQNIAEQAKSVFPWMIMILMSSVTFVGILSELMPSGVLTLMLAATYENIQISYLYSYS